MVNLHVPNSAQNLLNMVHDSQTNINGVLNSIKNGQIGGNVFFANPHGFVVGAGGMVNVGSLTAITPTRTFMNSFFDGPGQPNQSATTQLLAGSVPINPDAFISIEIVEYLAASISTTADPTVSSARLFESFIHAAEYDYGLIEYDDRYCRLRAAMLKHLPTSADFRERVASNILKNRSHLLEQSNSPLVPLLIYWHLARNNRPGTDSIAFIEHFIKRTFDSEQNRFFQRYWDLLAGRK